MSRLLEFRDKLVSFYSDYDVYIRPLLRFMVAVICFSAINNSIGYLNQINNIFVILILSVICAILPLNGIVLIGTVLIIAHSFGLSPEVGAFALILYLLMLLLYFRFVPRDALAIILTPAAFYFHVPAAVPVALGLIRGPLSAITAICGVLSWAYMHSLPEVIVPLLGEKDSSMLDVLQALPRALVSTETLLSLITFVVVLLIVAAIRKLVSEHSWEIGIIAGAILYYGLTVGGGFALGVKVDILEETVGTILSVAVCLVLEFFYYNADYSHTEYLEFEDDRNYYYVRVTPKKMPGYEAEEKKAGSDDDDLIPADDSRFTETDDSAVETERKFEGINLQSMLEKSLTSLNTNQDGRENNPPSEDTTGDTVDLSAKLRIPSGERDTSGDTKTITVFHLAEEKAKAGRKRDTDTDREDPDKTIRLN